MSWRSIEYKGSGPTGRLELAVPGVLSTGDEGDLAKSIHEFIQGTRDGELLRIMSPVIDDKGCVEDILAARRRGVAIRVLTTLADRHGIRTKGWDASQDIAPHDEAIRMLAKAGVILRSPLSTPHGKFVVLNKSSSLFGSANLTRGSLRGSALEALLRFEDPDILAALVAAFDAVWKVAPFSMRHRNGAVILEEGAANHIAIASEAWEVTGSAPRVVVSGPGCPGARDWLVETIKSARREVILVAMSFYESNGISGLHDALLGALRRGVRIRAVVRLEHFKDEENKGLYPDPSTAELIREGIELLGIQGLHAKGVSVDNSWNAIQSANFNPYSFDPLREECNVEILVCATGGTKLLTDYSKWIRMLADSADARWLPDKARG